MQLTFEQHIFELHGSTNIDFFFFPSKYKEHYTICGLWNLPIWSHGLIGLTTGL